MANQKDIRRRIKSINNTCKITRAMEMVSAAKMRKAVEQVLAIRPYAEAAWRVLTNLSQSFERQKEGFLAVRPVKKVLIVLVSSNRGLCGSFNAQIYKKLREQIENPEKLKINRVKSDAASDHAASHVKSDAASDHAAGRDKKNNNKELAVDFVVIGKKGEGMARKLSKEVKASFVDISHVPNVENVRPIAKIVIDEYLAKNYDKAIVVYTDYISTMKQETKIRQLLPISKIDLEKQIEDMDNLSKKYDLDKPRAEYKVEPSSTEVLNTIFPRLIEMQIYHALLESRASEESARMMAMRSATDAAGEMSESLTLAYNQLRQGKITQEISEISAGRVALE